MTAHEIDDLSVMLGAIKARLDGIETQFRDEREGSSRHRTDLRLVIASMSASVQTLTARVEDLSRQFTEAKPLIDDYRENRDQARGAVKAVTAFRAAVVAIGATLAAVIAWLVEQYRH